MEHIHRLTNGKDYRHTHESNERHLKLYSWAHPEGEGDPDAEKDVCGNPDCQCESYLLGEEE